jgi:probable rRNA maturation factor
MTIVPDTVANQVDLDVDIDIRCVQWLEEMPDVAGVCLSAANAAVAHGVAPQRGRSAGEISIVLADDDFVRALNRSWRDQDTPTNVLAFPASGDEMPDNGVHLFGDVIVAFQTSLREAEEQHKRLDHHLTHLIVHGVLHLLGYDHLADDDAEQMEGLETEILSGMGIDDPYCDRPEDS